MLTLLDETILPIDLKITARVAVQMRVGETPLGNPATRTTYIRGLDPKCSREQAMDIYKEHKARGHFEYPVSKVRHQILVNDILWMDEENMAKQARREERAARKAQREIERAERAARKAAKLAEKEAKAAARDAKRAAKKAAQTTLDFAEETLIAEEILVENAAPVVEKEKKEVMEVIKEEKKVSSSAPAQKTRGFTDEEIETYTKKLDALTTGKPIGSVVRLSYKQLLGLGIPVNFIRHYWGMTPQHTLPVTVGGRTAQKIDIDPDRTAQEPAQTVDAKQEELEEQAADTTEADRKEMEEDLAGVDMGELITRIKKVFAAQRVPFSMADPMEGETPLQIFDRSQAAVFESCKDLKRAPRRKIVRGINKELDHMIAGARNE